MDEISLDPTGFPVERPVPPDHRSGFVALVGRANVGKSTLLNQLVGRKVAIVSAVPQTTRTRVLGVRTTPNSQIAFIDSPGLHKPQHQMGELMNEAARSAAADADVVVSGTPIDLTRVLSVNKPMTRARYELREQQPGVLAEAVRKAIGG